jgi:hypothetical protein
MFSMTGGLRFVLRRPIETTALTGKVKFYFIGMVTRLYVQVEFNR